MPWLFSHVPISLRAKQQPLLGERLWNIIADTTTRKGRIFDSFIQSLILPCLVAFAVETLPDLSQPTRDLLFGFKVFCVGVFTIE